MATFQDRQQQLLDDLMITDHLLGSKIIDCLRKFHENDVAFNQHQWEHHISDCVRLWVRQRMPNSVEAERETRVVRVTTQTVNQLQRLREVQGNHFDRYIRERIHPPRRHWLSPRQVAACAPIFLAMVAYCLCLACKSTPQLDQPTCSPVSTQQRESWNTLLKTFKLGSTIALELGAQMEVDAGGLGFRMFAEKAGSQSAQVHQKLSIFLECSYNLAVGANSNLNSKKEGPFGFCGACCSWCASVFPGQFQPANNELEIATAQAKLTMTSGSNATREIDGLHTTISTLNILLPERVAFEEGEPPNSQMARVRHFGNMLDKLHDAGVKAKEKIKVTANEAQSVRDLARVDVNQKLGRKEMAARISELEHVKADMAENLDHWIRSEEVRDAYLFFKDEKQRRVNLKQPLRDSVSVGRW
ncbi:MAG: hypothetical protein Q9166_006727 [cf. Caloplaca sp. 2 TL-2023]